MSTLRPLLALSCALSLSLLPCRADNTLMDFEGSEYTTGQTVVGVHDSHLGNSATWTEAYAGGANRVTASAGTGVGSSRSLRIGDYTTSSAFGAALDLTSSLSLTQEFSVAATMQATGTHALNGTSQVQCYFGSGSGNTNWVNIKFNANNVLFYVKNSGGALESVNLGTHDALPVRITVVIDPVTKTFKSVVFKGVDFTSKVRKVNGGAIPCLSGTPAATFFLTSGTDDILNIDLDQLLISNTPEKYVTAVSEEWLPYIDSTTSVTVATNSALDLSQCSAFANGTIDSRGRIRIGPDGDFVYANGTPARLFCAAEAMHDLPVDLTRTVTDSVLIGQLDEYVAQLVRAGYNCYRPHFLDRFLMEGSSTDRVFNTNRYAIWQLLVKKLRDQGIYLYLDASTSWCAYYAVADSSTTTAKLMRLKTKLYWDPTVRAHWKAAVKQLFTTTNSHTGTTLASDPQVIGAVMRNEAGLKFQLENDTVLPALKDEPGLVALWHDWLTNTQTMYATVGNLNTAWGTSYATFNDVPMLDFTCTSTQVQLLERFIVDTEQETSLWLQTTLREVGVGAKCLLFDYNSGTEVPTSLSRDVQDLVDNHYYHDHGSAPGLPEVAWQHTNVSSCDGTLYYIRALAQTRIWGKPMTVTEWGHVFWNPWRHEGGLALPGYAALQGWSLIAQHAHPIALTPKPLSLFWVRTDPPAKASEYMAAMLYRRGDVSRSPNRLNIVVDPAEAYKTKWGQPWGLSTATFLTRIGVSVKWGNLILDNFASTLGVLAENSFGDISSTAFWTAANSTAGCTATTSGGQLVLTTTNSGYPSVIVRSTLSNHFNFFDNQMSFELKGIAFSPSCLVATNKQKLRLALTSQTGAPFGSEDVIVAEVGADNNIKVAYKVNETTGKHATSTNVVYDLTLTDYNNNALPARAIQTILFTPIAVPQFDVTTGAAADPAWELLVTYTNTNSTSESRRLNGRWHVNSTYSSTRALVLSNWGSTPGNSCVQIEAQKTDGLTTTGTMVVQCDSFRMLPRPKATAAPLADADFKAAYNYTYSSTIPTIATVMSDLAAAGVLGTGNLSDATGSSDTENGGTYHSDTKELLFKPAQRLIQVNTARSEGVTLPYDSAAPATYTTSATVSCLAVQNLDAPYFPNPVTVFATSLDGQNLNQSGKILLVISTDALNNAQYFMDYTRKQGCTNLNGNTIKGNGDLPILLKRSKIFFTLKNTNASSLKIYPLYPNGTRQNPASPVSSSTTTIDGVSALQATIDTGNLPLTGDSRRLPAVYFEITTDGVTSTQPATYQDWAGRYFTSEQLSDPGVSGYTATPWGDAVPNLLKFLCRIDPSVPLTASSSAALPAVNRQDVDSASYLCVTYRHSSDATGITTQLQSSTDLRTWQDTVPDAAEVAGTDPLTGDPITRLLVNCTGESTKFVRLCVTVL